MFYIIFGHTKIVFVVYLKFKFYWVSCTLSAIPPSRNLYFFNLCPLQCLPCCVMGQNKKWP